MSWWSFENWSPLVFQRSNQLVEFCGGPLDGLHQSRSELEPLLNLPMSAPVIDEHFDMEGKPVVVTSIAKYVVHSREGRWVYVFARSRCPIPRLRHQSTE